MLLLRGTNLKKLGEKHLRQRTFLCYTTWEMKQERSPGIVMWRLLFAFSRFLAHVFDVNWVQQMSLWENVTLLISSPSESESQRVTEKRRTKNCTNVFRQNNWSVWEVSLIFTVNAKLQILMMRRICSWAMSYEYVAWAHLLRTLDFMFSWQSSISKEI